MKKNQDSFFKSELMREAFTANALGIKDILIACMDGLISFPEAARSIYPDTRVQSCIVNMVRGSTKFVSYLKVTKTG
jgi:transposase-like protein